MKNKKIWVYLVLALVLAGICTYITYPGIYYSDSYTRWYFTENILAGTYENVNNGLSVFPQYIMALLYKISGEYGLFSFMQAAAFFFTSFLVIDRLCASFRWLWIALFTMCPIFYGFSVYMEMSTGLVIGINIFILLSFRAKYILAQGTVTAKILLTAGYAAAALLMFGCRQNAITMIPVMVAVFVIVSWHQPVNKRIKFVVLQSVAMMLVVVFLGRIPYMMNFAKVSDLTAKGTVWEISRMLQKVWDDEEYHDYFDFVGENATQLLYEKSNPRHISGHYSHVKIDYSNKELVYAINRRYAKLVLKEPVAYISTKFDQVMDVMGVTVPLGEEEYEYDWDGQGLMEDYGIRHSKARELFVQSYKELHRIVPLFRMPYIWYIAVLVLLAVCFKKLDLQVRTVNILLFFGACFYYGAFFITAQSYEFRYFFTALYLLVLAIFSLISNIVKKKEN